MAKIRLTGRSVSALPLPSEGVRIHYDAAHTGFGVRVSAGGSKSFILNYHLRGQERRFTIGPFPDLTVTAARERASHLRARIAFGFDPLAEKRAAKEAATVLDLAHDYMERHARPYKRPASVRNDKSMLDSIIKPKLGSRKVAALERRDIENLHRQLKATPYTANRVLALLGKMFALAESWGWRMGNPARGVTRYQEYRRERWLRPEELEKLTDALDKLQDQEVANAIRLMILTGARSQSEVLCARWEQFDLEHGMWTLPAHTTKQHRTEHFPLGADALALLRKMNKQSAAKEFLFPGTRTGTHRKEIRKAWAEVIKNAKLDTEKKEQKVTPHTLRHSFASNLVSSGERLELVGKLMGHTQPSTTLRYAKLAAEPLRAAADRMGKIARRKSKK